MNYPFSHALTHAKPSFIREILKMISDPEIISFGGGLPDAQLFPNKEIEQATQLAFSNYGQSLYQYSNTEGFLPLRTWLAERFSKQSNCQINPSQVLIVSGSQQALDLLGKVFLDNGDGVAIESPSYLGAIQAFKLFNPVLHEIDSGSEDDKQDNNSNLTDGINLNKLRTALQQDDNKFFYGIPNFQNPTGISYSKEKRQELANMLKEVDGLMIEDDPYGDIRFGDDKPTSVYSLAPDNVVYLSSFSKIFAPSFRLGWVVAPQEIIDKMVIAKQATDLHSNFFAQAILYEYLTNFDIDSHIQSIRLSYQNKRDVMVQAIEQYMPDDVQVFPNEGGMFLWIQIPNINAFELLDTAIKHKVAYVPGETFSTLGKYQDQIRLNYTGQSTEEIVQGIKNLAKAVKEYRKDSKVA